MPRAAPQDELVYFSPDHIRELNGLHINSVHAYFHASHYCDRQSVNYQLFNDVRNGVPGYIEIASDLTKAEEYLLENDRGRLVYILEHDPSERGRLAPHEHSGNWVIRKQIRRTLEDKSSYFETLGYYYIFQNELIMAAPSIASVFSGRTQNISKNLTEGLQMASGLPLFSAASGSTYEADTLQSRHAASSQEKAQGSNNGTPLQDNASRITAPSGARLGSSMYGPGLLADSLRLAFLYKDEFMDENPLVGEPGSFVMQKSRTDKTLVKPSMTKSVTPLPPPIETNIENLLTKGVKGLDKSATTPGGTKKRKRSKAAGSTTTPK